MEERTGESRHEPAELALQGTAQTRASTPDQLNAWSTIRTSVCPVLSAGKCRVQQVVRGALILEAPFSRSDLFPLLQSEKREVRFQAVMFLGELDEREGSRPKRTAQVFPSLGRRWVVQSRHD